MTKTLLPFALGGTLGNIAGANADGVLVGTLLQTNPSKVLLKTQGLACLCFTDDGGTYKDETTEANEATADDVEIVGATLAVADAIYVGHATKQAAAVAFAITTQGDYTTTTFTKKYWNGTAWTALSGVTDGTTNFEAATGTVTLTFDAPSDWERCLVDGVLGYWIQIECDATAATVTPCQIGQIWIDVDEADAQWVDETTDATDAGTDDVPLLPSSNQKVGDASFFGFTEKFCKLECVIGQEATGTHTQTLKYWNGTTWASVTTYDDDSAGWATAAGTHIIHFSPPADWVANTAENGPNGEAGFFVSMELTALTDVTQQPLMTQAWVYPLITGAVGMRAPAAATSVTIALSAMTASGGTNDSKFLLVNVTTGAFLEFTWTKTVPCDSASGSLTITENDELVVVQVTEDGTTELANATIHVHW